MQCPVCGSDRKPKDSKCPTCGVDFSKWVNKVIDNLNKKTKSIMDSTTKESKTEPPPKPEPKQPEPGRYREIIKQE